MYINIEVAQTDFLWCILRYFFLLTHTWTINTSSYTVLCTTRISDRFREELPESKKAPSLRSETQTYSFYVIFTVPKGIKIWCFSFWNLAGPFVCPNLEKVQRLSILTPPTVLHIDFLHTALGHEVPHLYQSAAFEWQPRTFNTVASDSPKKTRAINPWYRLKGQPPLNVLHSFAYPHVLHDA